MKTLGQVAYEKNKKCAIFGPWDTAPKSVRDSHENIAHIVITEFFKRAVNQASEDLKPTKKRKPRGKK